MPRKAIVVNGVGIFEPDKHGEVIIRDKTLGVGSEGGLCLCGRDPSTEVEENMFRHGGNRAVVCVTDALGACDALVGEIPRERGQTRITEHELQ